MQAAKACDAYGLMPGHVIEQCDAEQAYIQSRLDGPTPTWVRLPRDQWPKGWSGYRDPVCPLVLALYGHPDAGGYWERHCEKHLKDAGFVPIPDWRSCFWNKNLKLFLVVYVDDFKLSGPSGTMPEGWRLIRKHIRTETPTPVGKYLGCEHVPVTFPTMADKSVLRAQLALEGITPALGPPGATRGVSTGPPVSEKSTRGSGQTTQGMVWDMSDFLRQCVALYQDIGGAKAKVLKHTGTPFLELPVDMMEDERHNGELAPIASRVLMKVLYAARMARFDLLRATCFLATRVTKWSEACDRLLHRMMCYIDSTKDLCMHGWVGDNPKDLELVLYTDADFAGDVQTSRSTSGVFLCLKGPNSFVPLSALSKRQSCVSHSTPEAEIVAADAGLRSEAIPEAGLWEALLGRKVVIRLKEDNQATIKIFQSGKNKEMRHMGCTHRVDLAFIHESLVDGHFTIEYCETTQMPADIFTKAFANA